MILAGAAAAFVLGAVLGSLFGPTGWILLPAVVLLLVLAWLARRRRGWPIAVLAAALCLGIWRSPHLGPATSADLRYYNGQVVVVLGTVSAEPDIRDTGASYQVSIDARQIGNTAHALGGGLYLHTSSAVHLDYGDRVMLTGRLSPTPESGFGASLARQGIFSEMRFPKIVDLGPSPSASPFSLALMHFRQRLEAGIDAWLPEPEAALLIAITLGARSSELGDLAPILITTGLIHLIAISGIKVALVAGMIQQAIRSLTRRLLSYLGATVTLWVYVLLTGFTPSGVRSAGMWTMVFVAGALGRGTVPWVSLSFVAALMVAADPRLPWDIGFEMSVVGTLAIVLFAGQIIHWISRLRLRVLPVLQRGPAEPHSIPVVFSPLREALAVTIAAQAGTVPIVVLGFGVLSLTGPLSNMVALPLLPLLIILGFLLGALSGVSSLAAPIAGIAYALLHLIVVVAAHLAALGGTLELPPFNLPEVLGYYALLGIGALVLVRLRVHSARTYTGQGREMALAGLVGMSLLTVSVVAASGQPGTRLTWLGTGNSMLLQSGGMTALIDGSNQPFTLLERIGSLLPSDVHTIDLVIVTDPRSKNVSGLDSLLPHYRIGEVLDVGAEYPSQTYARWRADLRAGHVPAFALRTGVTVALGAARITSIGPDALYPVPPDCAGLLRVALPQQTLLLATAADVREQHEAVFRGVQLRSGALLAGAAQDAAFMRAVSPARVLDAERLPRTTMTLYPVP